MDLNRSQNLEVQKDKILGFIETNGPSLPIHISKYLKIDSMLSSAFLADLLSDKQVKISNMRVGNSPIYYLRGQEFQLEKFSNFLGGKEREVFHLLKEKKVLRDDRMLPATRVALRAIKDFSFSFDYNGVLFWRFIQVNEQEAADMISAGGVEFNQITQRAHILAQKEIVKQEAAVQPEVIREEPKIEEKIEEEKVEESLEEKPVEEEIEEEKEKTELDIFDKKVKETSNIENLDNLKDIEDTKTQLLDEIKRQAGHLVGKITKKGKEKKKSAFEEEIDSFFEEQDIDVVQEIKFKKKDGSGIVRISDASESKGKEYLCIIRDKKMISEMDVMTALKSGQKARMPVVFVSSGEPNKKAEEWITYFGDLFVFKKMK
jgi:hypothetical protein